MGNLLDSFRLSFVGDPSPASLITIWEVPSKPNSALLEDTVKDHQSPNKKW